MLHLVAHNDQILGNFSFSKSFAQQARIVPKSDFSKM